MTVTRRYWTEQEVQVLRAAAGRGVRVAAIQAKLEAAGFPRRSIHSIRRKLHEMYLEYGVRTARHWLRAELALLRRVAGRLTVPEMVVALEEECGTTRTEQAVRKQLSDMQLSCVPDDAVALTTPRLEWLLGCSDSYLRMLCNRGELPHRREAGPRQWPRYIIEPAAVRAWIQREFLRFEPARMHGDEYRALVELLVRQHRYLSADQAAQRAGLHPRRITRACASGDLPAVKVRTFGPVHPTARWYLRAGDLEQWLLRQRKAS